MQEKERRRIRWREPTIAFAVLAAGAVVINEVSQDKPSKPVFQSTGQPMPTEVPQKIIVEIESSFDGSFHQIKDLDVPLGSCIRIHSNNGDQRLVMGLTEQGVIYNIQTEEGIVYPDIDSNGGLMRGTTNDGIAYCIICPQGLDCNFSSISFSFIAQEQFSVALEVN